MVKLYASLFLETRLDYLYYFRELMANNYFQFKQFTIYQDRCAMKVTTDGCLFGAWTAERVRAREFGDASRALDIGAGTGLLSLMLAQQSNLLIDAVEIDAAAAEQAAENTAASPWKERIRIIPGDIKNAETLLPATHYDTILSNPPFYENELISPDNRKNIAHHQQGLLITDLLTVIQKKLADKGRFYLMLPFKRLVETDMLLKQFHFSKVHLALIRQSPRHDPFRVFIVGKQGVEDGGFTEEDIVIRNGNDEYSSEAGELLREYYLRL